MVKTKWPNGTVISRETWHFHRNLFERYGLVLNPGEYSHICRLIKSGFLTPLKIDHGGDGKFYCYTRKYGQFGCKATIYIVANPKSHELISVYGPEWIQKRLRAKMHSRNKKASRK